MSLADAILLTGMGAVIFGIWKRSQTKKKQGCHGSCQACQVNCPSSKVSWMERYKEDQKKTKNRRERKETR